MLVLERELSVNEGRGAGGTLQSPLLMQFNSIVSSVFDASPNVCQNTSSRRAARGLCENSAAQPALLVPALVVRSSARWTLHCTECSADSGWLARRFRSRALTKRTPQSALSRRRISERVRSARSQKRTHWSAARRPEGGASGARQCYGPRGSERTCAPRFLAACASGLQLHTRRPAQACLNISMYTRIFEVFYSYIVARTRTGIAAADAVPSARVEVVEPPAAIDHGAANVLVSAEKESHQQQQQLVAPTATPSARRPSRSSLHLYIARVTPTSSIRRSYAAGMVGSIDRDLNTAGERASVRRALSTPSRMRPAIIAAFERRERRVTTTLAVVIGAALLSRAFSYKYT